MSRKKHPIKEIEGAIQYAETRGWHYKKSGNSAHAWGQLLCPHNSDLCRCGEFCAFSIWSTPRNPTSHAKQIKRNVDKCIFLVNEAES
jgi:hypothetical protein